MKNGQKNYQFQNFFDTCPFSDCSHSVFKCIGEKLLKQEVSQFQGRNAITAGAL